MKITVYGTPGPQGSKKFVGVSKKGKGIMIESSAKVKPWRQAVFHEALAIMGRESMSVPAIPGPVRVTMMFTLARPKSAKPGAVPSKKPDLSKLVRSTEDALTKAGVYEDDARIVWCESTKTYPFNAGDPATLRGLDRPGCVITIEAA